MGDISIYTHRQCPIQKKELDTAIDRGAFKYTQSLPQKTTFIESLRCTRGKNGFGAKQLIYAIVLVYCP